VYKGLWEALAARVGRDSVVGEAVSLRNLCLSSNGAAVVMNETPKQMKPFQSAIEGKRVSSIVFVEDYLQIIFDDYVFTMFVWPEVSHKGRILRNNHDDYRNSLCELIDQRVIKAQVQEGEQVSLLFSNGAEVSMSLKEKDRTSVEAGTFSGQKNKLFIVWN
jgi:hypothetical protein